MPLFCSWLISYFLFRIGQGRYMVVTWFGVTSLWLEYYTLLLLDKMHSPCMCLFYLVFYLFFVDIFFTLLQSPWVWLGSAFSVVDYVLVVVVGCVLVLWVFQENLVVGVGCIQSQTQTLCPLLPNEKHFKPTRLNKEEFLVTWWSAFCTVTILLFFFVTLLFRVIWRRQFVMSFLFDQDLIT